MTSAARAVWLGRRRYEPIHALQKRLVEARGRGQAVSYTHLTLPTNREV